MYVRVDDSSTTDVEGYSYENQSGEVESVKLPASHETWVVIKDSGGRRVNIYVSDIPKLVKALEAAHKHVSGNN